MNEPGSERYVRIYENEKLDDREINSSSESVYNELLEHAIIIFCWDDIKTKGTSQKDSEKLVKYIHKNYNVEWVLKARVEKSENNTTIKIAYDNNSLLLELDDQNKKVTLTIDNKRRDEFNARKKKDKLNIYENSARATAYLSPLRNSLIPHYVKSDLLAIRYQSKYMKAGNLIYYMAAAAVLTVAFQMIFFSEYYQLLILEFAEIVIVLGALFFSHYGEYQRKWIDYRFLAERLRVGFFMWVAGRDCKLPDPPPYLAVPVREDDWTVKTFSRIWDERPNNINATMEFIERFLKAAWINDQLAYFIKKSKQHGSDHSKFTRWGAGLFVLTVVVATIDAFVGLNISIPVDFSHYHSSLAFMAITFPTLSATIAGIRIHREYQRNAQRYTQMSLYLDSVSKQIDQAQDINSLNNILDGVNDMFVLENHAWRAEFERGKLEAP